MIGALLVALCSAPARAEIIDRILAVVSGQLITKSDLDAAVALGFVERRLSAGESASSGLEALIDRLLMLNEVRRVVPPEPSDAAIEARVARIRQRFASPAGLTAVLDASGIDDTVLRIHAADDLRLASYLNDRFSAASQPTEEEVRQAGEGARETLASTRREALISAWIAELRRRADITLVTPASPRPDTRISPSR